MPSLTPERTVVLPTPDEFCTENAELADDFELDIRVTVPKQVSSPTFGPAPTDTCHTCLSCQTCNCTGTWWVFCC